MSLLENLVDLFVGDDPGAPITTPTRPPGPTPGQVPTPTPLPNATPAPVGAPPPIPLPALPPARLPAPPTPTGPARYSAADYTDAARALLPQGRVWPAGPDSVQGKVLAGLAVAFECLDAAANTLLAGSLPGAELSGFVPEWEATLGLPDPCAGDSPTFAQRRDQIRARFIGGGGQSRQYYIDVAAALDFDISIANNGPFRCGLNSISDPIVDERWSFVWTVTIELNRGGLPHGLLFCELDAIKPAGTTIVGGPP